MFLIMVSKPVIVNQVNLNLINYLFPEISLLLPCP